MKTPFQSAAERYDYALRRGRDHRLPPDAPRPQPTAAWPPENIVLLDRYYDWLLSGGTSLEVVYILYIPMAGHVLGLNLKSHEQLDLDADLTKALDYVRAKQLSDQWISMCRGALFKFRLFLRQQRGQNEVALRPLNCERYHASLPHWLIERLERYQHLMQRNWRPARINQQIMRFWSGHSRLWRWLFEHYAIASLADIKRQYVLDYIDHRLTAGYAVSGINNELHCFHAFLLYLREQGDAIPLALLRIACLKQPERLPRFLTDAQVRALRDDFEQRVAQAQFSAQRRDALLDRAAFYLLWQGGLRVSEVEELRQEDLDTLASLSAGLAGCRLTVRQGKGQKDRTVYLTRAATQALQAYLEVRGMGASDHVFLYRHQPLSKDLIPARIRAAGERAGVKVTPHRLRHTFATQLLNVGCRVTSIQKLLGHRRLNSTMIYARAHDHTVAADYYAAMAQIEKGLDASDGVGQVPDAQPNANERGQLLVLLDRLADPQISVETRLDLIEQMRHLVIQ